jgi:hypothetical protein
MIVLSHLPRDSVNTAPGHAPGSMKFDRMKQVCYYGAHSLRRLPLKKYRLFILMLSIVILFFGCSSPTGKGKSGEPISLTSPNNISEIDLSESPYFPPFLDQGITASCDWFACAYYQMTYTMNKLYDRPSDASNSFSPKFGYTIINNANTFPVNLWFLDVYGFLQRHGSPFLTDVPYDMAQGLHYREWTTDPAVWQKALGAVKPAESYRDSVINDGFRWVSYQAVRDASTTIFYENKIWQITMTKDYTPKVVAQVILNNESRESLKMQFGRAPEATSASALNQPVSDVAQPFPIRKASAERKAWMDAVLSELGSDPIAAKERCMDADLFLIC